MGGRSWSLEALLRCFQLKKMYVDRAPCPHHRCSLQTRNATCSKQSTCIRPFHTAKLCRFLTPKHGFAYFGLDSPIPAWVRLFRLGFVYSGPKITKWGRVGIGNGLRLECRLFRPKSEHFLASATNSARISKKCSLFRPSIRLFRTIRLFQRVGIAETWKIDFRPF